MEPRLETRTCRICGATFETYIDHQVYCSTSCRMRAQQLRQHAKSRQKAAENEARRKQEVTARNTRIERAKADAERRREELKRRAIERWGGEERYQAHLEYQKAYRLAHGPRHRISKAEALERFRAAEAMDEVEEARQEGPAVRVCSVCGCEIGPDGPDLCCLCARAVTRENAERAAATEAQWIHVKTRYCHDCSKPCNGYRCPKCLHKWRRRHGVKLES